MIGALTSLLTLAIIVGFVFFLRRALDIQFHLVAFVREFGTLFKPGHSLSSINAIGLIATILLAVLTLVSMVVGELLYIANFLLATSTTRQPPSSLLVTVILIGAVILVTFGSQILCLMHENIKRRMR